ncbi:hypothetical protein [Escherichia coli]|uniref:hypothetical protein n=1 Tax=Escherichia coli TaxID=562 RepID=UPI0024142504|nr:hypothetical protein [Escherichia coli]WFM54236.1 hypothetical protein P6H31_06510 [Escherichia coli]
MAEGTIKDLVASGHALADDMTGAPSVLVRCLATQLEVQLVRANALAAENARLKAAHPQPFGHEMMKALDAYEKYQDEVPETGMLNAFFILRDSIRVDTQATDAFLAEVRAQGVGAAIEAAKNLVAKEYECKDFKAAQSDCCMHPGSDLVGKVEMTEWLVDFASQLRKGGNQ